MNSQFSSNGIPIIASNNINVLHGNKLSFGRDDLNNNNILTFGDEINSSTPQPTFNNMLNHKN